MPTFNPSTVIEDLDGVPLKSGTIDDADDRAKINKIRVRLAKADEKDQPPIQEELRLAVEAAQSDMTVGSAIIGVLANPLPAEDDKERRREESLSGEEKVDLMMLAIKIKTAMNEGNGALVTIDEKEAKKIKERVNRGYTGPLVVGRIYAAIKPDEKK